MNPYKEILRKFFSKYVSTLRKRRGLTQEEMAEKLRITGRAYSDLERGIYCFSAVALVFLLLMLEEGGSRPGRRLLNGGCTRRLPGTITPVFST